jgi:hypothetical protein
MGGFLYKKPFGITFRQLDHVFPMLTRDNGAAIAGLLEIP